MTKLVKYPKTFSNKPGKTLKLDILLLIDYLVYFNFVHTFMALVFQQLKGLVRVALGYKEQYRFTLKFCMSFFEGLGSMMS
jgi:hypothetical protein